jgi:hypothetical protein
LLLDVKRSYLKSGSLAGYGADALVENAEKSYWETGDGQVDARRVASSSPVSQ